MVSFGVLMELNEAAMALNVWNNPFAAARAYRRALEMIKEEDGSTAASPSVPSLEEATCCTDLAQIYLDHTPDSQKDEMYPQALQLVESSEEILTKRGILQSQSSPPSTGNNSDVEKVNVLLSKYYVARGHALIANGRDAEGRKFWNEAEAAAAKPSDLLLQIGSKLKGMGRPGEAIPYIKRSIEIDKQGKVDENSHDFAAAYSNLCSTLADSGDNDEAIVAGKEFVRIMKHIHEKALSSSDGGDGQTLLEVSNACELLGTIYREAGNIDESIGMYREAIDFWKTSPRYSETIEFAEKYNSLGFVMEMLPERLNDARESCLEAIRILDTHSPALGGISSQHEKAYFCIGSTYSKEKKWDDCIASFDKALAVQRELYKRQKVPPDLIVETCFKLIEASNNRGQERQQVEVDKVHEYRMEAYNMFVQHAPEEIRLQQQPFLVLCEDIAKWHKCKHDSELCLEFIQQAMDGWKKLAPDSMKAAMVAVAVGAAYHELSNLEKALEHFEFALGVATKSKTDDDSASALTCLGLSQYNIGNILHERGELDTALKSCQKSLEAFRSLSGEEGEQCHPLLSKVLFSIGTIQHDQNLINEARTTLQEALKTHQQLSLHDGFLDTIQKALDDIEEQK